MSPLRGVITDWGGVMTSPIAESVDRWLATERIDRATYAAVMRRWVTGRLDGDASPVHRLERGELPVGDFERLLAARLVLADGGKVDADRLIARMFVTVAPDTIMLDLIRSLRGAGVRTGMLSNSWSGADYPRQLFPELFDAVVISAEVGMRKPEERIFRLAADRLGLEPRECVFIDDLKANVAGAEAAGFVAVLHTAAAATQRRLAELLS